MWNTATGPATYTGLTAGLGTPGGSAMGADMADPITAGVFISWALGLAGEAIIKGTAGEAVKDAYQALKAKLSHWAAGDVGELEKAPSSKTRQAVLAEVVD